LAGAVAFAPWRRRVRRCPAASATVVAAAAAAAAPAAAPAACRLLPATS
jgi:hypothetical protein